MNPAKESQHANLGAGDAESGETNGPFSSGQNLEELPQDWFGRLYQELKTLASSYMRRERQGHTLQTTALVHEAYLRLATQKSSGWHDRKSFFAAAATTMRRLLVDHARASRAAKRGGDLMRHSLDQIVLEMEERAHDVIELDRALERLAKQDARMARIVELRFFVGLTTDQTANILGTSPRSVAREWALARSWLLGELENAPPAQKDMPDVC